MTEVKTSKPVKELFIGDRVRIVEPDGIAEVTHIERSRLFQAAGGCFRLDMKIIGGPNKGQRIRDQHHGGEEEIELA